MDYSKDQEFMAIVRDRSEFKYPEDMPLLDDDMATYGDSFYSELQSRRISFIHTDPFTFSCFVLETEPGFIGVVINEDSGQFYVLELGAPEDYDSLYQIVDTDDEYWLDFSGAYKSTMEKVLEMAV